VKNSKKGYYFKPSNVCFRVKIGTDYQGISLAGVLTVEVPVIFFPVPFPFIFGSDPPVMSRMMEFLR
jgi:hypothetical protein